MKIVELNNEITERSINAINFAYDTYLIPVAKKNHLDLSSATDEDKCLICAQAGYIPASRDVLTYCGSTIYSSYFLPKNLKIIKEKQDELVNKVCNDIITKLLLSKEFSTNKCLTAIDKIFEIFYFRENVRDFSYGNAQKWVNMAIKFYFVLDAKLNFDSNVIELYNDKKFYNYILFPIDSIMIQKVKKDYGKMSLTEFIDTPFSEPSPWSSCNSKITFVEYWNFVIKNCGNIPPLLYEICNWEPKK